MAAEFPQRNYRMTDAELGMFVSNLCITLTRDLTDLTVFGVTAPKIAALKALGDAFEVFTSDSVALANIIGATEAKNTTVESLKEGIRNMALRCQIKWGAKSHQEKSLDITGLNDLNNKELLFVARRVHGQMTLFLPDLADLGLTEAVLDEYLDLIELSETKLNEQATQINTRDIMTKNRILKGNELYTEAVNYCNIGKRVYAMTDPAKYNDYIIYDSFSAGSLTSPENLTVDVITMIFTWDAVENATSYQLETSIVGTDWEEIYSGEENFVNYVPPVEGLRQYRVRARNSSGYGPSSVVMYYNYVAILPAPGYISLSVINATTGAIALNWEEVATAEFYRLYHSQVALNAPDPGEYTMLGEFTVASYSGNVNTGYRHWFQVVSGNSEKLSVASDAVYVDMPLVP
ncbi:MAG: fibronectin type III domain-containing protein [Candidatus Kapabacteria bacterium]|nr:fibronectin type III domain-containing protein [Candidatus Kapabacteria bacterium]